jgi:hypothetical protein
LAPIYRGPNVVWRLKGRAKAMVVTSSRLHAVCYEEALDRCLREHGYRLGVLVAFSGTVFDEGEPRTEAEMNHFLDTQTAAEFDTDALECAGGGREVPDRLRSAAADGHGWRRLLIRMVTRRSREGTPVCSSTVRSLAPPLTSLFAKVPNALRA